MIVIDASALVELLLMTPAGPTIANRALDPSESLHAPELLDLEVLQVLRRYVLNGTLDQTRAAQAVQDLFDLPITRYPHWLLLSRIWELRNNITAYDASYVALAEVIEAPLVTADKRLAASSGHRARIELLSDSED